MSIVMLPVKYFDSSNELCCLLFPCTQVKSPHAKGSVATTFDESEFDCANIDLAPSKIINTAVDIFIVIAFLTIVSTSKKFRFFFE